MKIFGVFGGNLEMSRWGKVRGEEGEEELERWRIVGGYLGKGNGEYIKDVK